MSLKRLGLPPLGWLMGTMLVPSGRCDRRGLLVCALALLGLQTLTLLAVLALGVSPHSPPLLLVDAILLWMGTCSIAKRLHDLGLPATRIIWTALGILVWSTVVALAIVYWMGEAALAPDGIGIGLAAFGSSLPVLGLTLWAHLARGMRGPNRFGPATDDSGFSPPAPRPCACDQAGDAHSITTSAAPLSVPAMSVPSVGSMPKSAA